MECHITRGGEGERGGGLTALKVPQAVVTEKCHVLDRKLAEIVDGYKFDILTAVDGFLPSFY